MRAFEDRFLREKKRKLNTRKTRRKERENEEEREGKGEKEGKKGLQSLKCHQASEGR